MKKYILLTTITVCLLFADSLSSLAQNKNATVKSNIPVWNDDSLKDHHVKLVDPGNAPKYNLDSIVAVSKMSIPIETGKVIIERFDSVAIDLIFLPNNEPYSHKITTIPGDTGKYIWFMTSGTNDPRVRSDGGHYNDPGRAEEPGSFENFYTIGMATYRKSHPDFSVIGFEERMSDTLVAANNFKPYWIGLIILLKKTGDKYTQLKRFKYGWHYTGNTRSSKVYDVFEYSPSVTSFQAAFDYHKKAINAYPQVLPSEPAKNVVK